MAQMSSCKGDLMATEPKTFTIWPFSEKVSNPVEELWTQVYHPIQAELGSGPSFLSDSEIHKLSLYHLVLYGAYSCGRGSQRNFSY